MANPETPIEPDHGVGDQADAERAGRTEPRPGTLREAQRHLAAKLAVTIVGQGFLTGRQRGEIQPMLVSLARGCVDAAREILR